MRLFKKKAPPQPTKMWVIQWEKIKTVKDVKALLKLGNPKWQVAPDSPNLAKLMELKLVKEIEL